MAELKEQAGKILGYVAGYVATRTIEMGVTKGIFQALGRHPEGIDLEGLASDLGYDPFYLEVWLRSAVAAGIVSADGPDEDYDPRSRRFSTNPDRRFKLEEQMDALLLDKDCPSFVGALPTVLEQPEFFDRFAANLASGDRLWWNECSHEAIQAVSNTGWSFYVRMLPEGIAKIPGLKPVLDGGAKIVELCCGAGKGTERMATFFPKCTITSVDGDSFSLRLTKKRLSTSDLGKRVETIHSSLEEMQLPEGQDMVFINISMHECRDIDRVVQNVKAALKPGGYFVISDFPFPATREAQQTLPGRIMGGIQFFEALIDDQLMPTSAFVDLLKKHGFRNVDSYDLTGVHAVTYGQA